MVHPAWVRLVVSASLYSRRPSFTSSSSVPVDSFTNHLTCRCVGSNQPPSGVGTMSPSVVYLVQKARHVSQSFSVGRSSANLNLDSGSWSSGGASLCASTCLPLAPTISDRKSRPQTILHQFKLTKSSPLIPKDSHSMISSMSCSRGSG